ncbi:MAG: hypothetical protein VW405_07630 [Rhodospirillaceae bacterium]
MSEGTKSGRGILYVVWGRFDRALLDRSMASAKAHHPDLPIEVARLADDATLLDKAGMLDLSPFAETLFLDADTVVLGDLDFGFAKAARHGLACSICECPWARRYGGIEGDVVEYNTGVLFFTEAARPVFDAWKAHVGTVDSSIVFRHGDGLAKMPLNDQAGFALAVDRTGFPLFVLPYNWNFRPKWHKSWYGPLKIWHDYEPVPEPIVQRCKEQSRAEAIIDFSALRDG